MRRELLYNPLALLERLGEWAAGRRRVRRLRQTAAQSLREGHLDSLELLELLKKENLNVIFDIGANVGTWTLLAKAIHPAAQVHAFEPLQKHAACFRSFVEGVANVELHQVALGPSNSKSVLRELSFSDASSVLPLAEAGRAQWGLSDVEQSVVEMRRLDDYVAQNQLPQPDLIKLDVQGFELEVLRGAPATIAAAKAVIAEVSFKEFYTGQCRFDEVVTYLAESGFYLRAFGAGIPVGKALAQCDVLFWHDGLLERD